MKLTADSLVVLSGASAGIGRCLARELITRYHCRVIGIARHAARLQDTAQELGDLFEPCPFDVSDRTAWQRLAARLQTEGRAVDLLMCGAGVLPAFDRAERVSSETVAGTLEINFYGAVYAVEALKERLLSAAAPAVTVISSAGGIAPLAGTSAYAASKAAATAYFSALREEWRGRVQVTVVCPGFVRTDIFRHQPTAGDSARLLSAVAMEPTTCARRILRAVKCGRGYRVLGADGHLLSAGMRLCPTLTLRLCRRILRASGLSLFAAVFE